MSPASHFVMITLGIETSGRAGSVALLRDGELLENVELSASGRRHARTLVPEIGELLLRHQLTSFDVDVVGVSIGPGSFTGLRTGCVCAKTFAFATGCRIVGVDTFLAVASQSPPDVRSVWVIDDALRGDLFAGEYHQSTEGDWSCVTPPRLVALAEWRSLVTSSQSVSGPGVEKLTEDLQGLALRTGADCSPQAASVARLASQRADRNQCDDAWSLEPVYIRRSAAEEKADAKASGQS
ncbi:tRNA (adenosine(37)-N6)-threonylcarbamoyltransferase complex dimerization subunit type 1 TsaB [Planctomicrobium sp. SH664]|uniref:tRNA (adenosine(37)-N6)-threonylcarbamoyltransferase complex dimerization subunit type 1 TsaB n=1 Tax=Planctomicrobium sp. SH664 TaxID=3448125 RepID=UPI003F5B2344